MDDYITGVEQVGVDPTDPVEAVVPVETQDKVDPGTDVYEFKEYDLKEYDNKESVDKAYDYGDYSPTDAKPPSETYEEEFGPGVPAETDFSVSTGMVGGGESVVAFRNLKRCGRRGCHSFNGVFVVPFLFVVFKDFSLKYSAHTSRRNT